MIDAARLLRYDVISFDLFDTLITRKYINPKDIFHEMELQLGKGFEGFGERRIKAELEARRTKNFEREVTLDEIYDYLFNHLPFPGLTQEASAQMRQMELKIERGNLIVNREIHALIGALKAAQKKVIFISDIYLPKTFLLETLRGLGIEVEEEQLFVSSEYGVMKSNRLLFEKVVKRLQVAPKKVCHIGDNAVSDVEKPKSLGIHAIHYRRCIANRYETLPERKSTKLSRLNALARRSRLDNPYRLDDAHKATLWDVTSNVSAPLMTAYVLWCIQKAVELKLKTIFFLSRDGQVLYKIAKTLIGKLDVDIALKYLYVSRQSLLFPALEKLDEGTLEWIMAPTAVLTPRIILKRINFDPDEISESLKTYGFEHKLDRHLSQEAREKFRQMLGSLEVRIVARAREYKANTKAYFRQEGLYDGAFALVDIGWSGTLQRSIGKILAEDGYEHPTYGLYFGVKRRKKFKDSDEMHGWFTDHRHPRELDKKAYIIPMTELFTAALHGGVVRHVRHEERFGAQLLKTHNETGLKWGVDVQHEAMVHYAGLLAEMPHLLKGLMQHQELDHLEKQYETFLLNPSRPEAECYGAYLDAEDQNESYHVRLARPYSLREQLKMRKEPDFMHHHNEWRAGALALTEPKLYPYLISKHSGEKPKKSKVIIFLHIPKCGGMSVRKALCDNFEDHDAYTIGGWNDEAMQKTIDALRDRIAGGNRPKLVMGHIAYGVHRQLGLEEAEVIYISVMREPIERVLSFYKYVRQSKEHLLHAQSNALPFHEFIRLDKVRPEISNVQYRHLAGRMDRDFTAAFTRFAGALERNAVIVGTLEAYDKTIEIFNGFFSINMKNSIQNQSEMAPFVLSEEDRAFLEEINKKDYTLYNLVRKNLEKRGLNHA